MNMMRIISAHLKALRINSSLFQMQRKKLFNVLLVNNSLYMYLNYTSRHTKNCNSLLTLSFLLML